MGMTRIEWKDMVFIYLLFIYYVIFTQKWYGITLKIVKIYGMRVAFTKTETTWDGVVLKKIENTQDRGRY